MCDAPPAQRWLTRLLLVLLCGLAGLSGRAAAVELTPEEHAWLKANEPVIVGVGPPTPYPFAYYAVQLPQNRPGAEPIVTGHAADLMALLAERAGMKIRYVSVPDVPTGLAMMKAGKIHMTPVLRMTPARREFLTMPAPLAPVEMVWVVRRDAPHAQALQQQQGLRAVALLGSPILDAVQTLFPRAEVTGTRAEAEGVAMVADGRADITLVDLHDAIQTIERNRLPGLQIRRTPKVQAFEAGPMVGIQFPLLHSIVAKALNSVSPAERTLLARRWLPQPIGTVFDSQTAVLSAEERAWVDRQPALRVGFDAALPPLTQAGSKDAAGASHGDAEGFHGLAADVLRQALQKVGLRIGSAQGGVPDALPGLAASGALDVAVGLARTPANNAAFLLVGPYLRASTVIVMHSAAPQAATELRDLQPGTLAMLRSEPLLAEVQSRFPASRIVTFDHLDDALQAVAGGTAIAAIGNAFSVNHLIQQRHAGRLQVTGVVRDGEVALHFGVPRSQPELARVLALGLEALSPSDMSALRQRWLLLRVDNGLKWADVLRWALPVVLAMLAVLVVLALANRRLRAAREVADLARAEAEAANAARGRFLVYLAHEVRGLVNSIGWGARLMLDKHPQASPDQVAGWIRSSAESTGRLLESTLENERALAHGVTITPVAHDLAAWWQDTLAPHALTAASKQLQLRLQPPLADAPLRFDPLRLAQVVHNLVGNAVKFTSEGEVAVSGRWDASTRRLRVDVQDSGPGLPAAELRSVWEPYTQGSAGRDAGAGAGLGLAITRQLVTAMGGTVQAATGSRRGSHFWFEVPLETAA